MGEMMADGKWISGLSAEMSLPEAARHVLYVRMQVVRDYLPRVLHESERDTEHVHQLRVGTRRADAALRIFRPCLPEKTYRLARRRLRGLRRAAGAARDWDVFLLNLVEYRDKQPEADQSGLDLLSGYALGQRCAVQVTLTAVVQEERLDFESHLTDLIGAVRHPEDHSYGRQLSALARPTLTRLREDLERAASGDLTDYVHLHQVRIAGKRLRYALEVFADCFGAKMREELYPRVEEMQEILGRANDSHVAAERLTVLRERLRSGCAGEWGRYRPGIDRLLRHHQRTLPRERQRFLKWWHEWRDGPSEALLTLVLGEGQTVARA
jgi:CHAD domain-containing protein